MTKNNIKDKKFTTIDSKNDKNEPSTENTKENNPPQELDPTRFGDWEKNGRCSDF